MKSIASLDVWRMGVIAVVLVTLSGCGKSAAMTRNDLRQAGLAYHSHHDANQRGPSNWDELVASGLDQQAATRLKDAGYEFRWGVKFSELKEGTSFTVMAESKTGDYKLMMDGSVQQ
ncbi:MAG: hypothetical protein AB7O62_25760 [Pirellulales bacterium]